MLQPIDFIGEPKDMKNNIRHKTWAYRGPNTALGVQCLAIIVTVVTILGCATSRNPFKHTPKEGRVNIANPVTKSANTIDNVTPYGKDDPLLNLLREARVNEHGVVTDGDHSLPASGSRLVKSWIKYFQTNGKPSFEKWLARSRSYVPIMKEILRSEGLPEEFVYLAMIESGFNPQAYSPAAAAGQWQFIKGTGTRYGLTVNRWVDDRRDPIKSTIAAARHLKDLFDEFESWKLAAAGYNAGSGKIRTAIRRYKSEDFWYLSRYKYLRDETKNYVPKMIAAAIISRNPAKYGFTNVKYERPYEFDEITVYKQTSLTQIAKTAGVDMTRVKKLNPHILRDSTPPNTRSYTVRIPKGTTTDFAESFIEQTLPANKVEVAVAGTAVKKKTPSSSRSKIVHHRVRRGQTLSGIAKRYGVTISSLMRRNKLRSPRDLRAGQILAIPSNINRKALRGSNTGVKKVKENDYNETQVATEQKIDVLPAAAPKVALNAEHNSEETLEQPVISEEPRNEEATPKVAFNAEHHAEEALNQPVISEQSESAKTVAKQESARTPMTTTSQDSQFRTYY